MLEAIKSMLGTAMLAFLVVFLWPVALVLLSLLTSSWIPIVLGVGITVFSAAAIIKKHQAEQGVEDDNRSFNPELQEKAIAYLMAAREKEKDQK